MFPKMLRMVLECFDLHENAVHIFGINVGKYYSAIRSTSVLLQPESMAFFGGFFNPQLWLQRVLSENRLHG